jgi:hypothetical protein
MRIALWSRDASEKITPSAQAIQEVAETPWECLTEPDFSVAKGGDEFPVIASFLFLKNHFCL